MENLDLNQRKRHSSKTISPDGVKGKKKCLSSATTQSTPSLSHSEKLIDRLYLTWKNNIDFTSQAGPSQKERQSQASTKLTSKQAALKLKKMSIEQKLSELKSKRSKFCTAQMMIGREQKFYVGMLDNAWEIVQPIYENIKFMLENEATFDQRLSDSSEIRSAILQKLQGMSEKLVAAPIERECLETQINNVNTELENVVKTLKKLKEEDEKVQSTDPECFLNDMKKDLHSIEEDIFNLIEGEIGLETGLQEKTDQSFEQDCKHTQDLQELEKDFNKLETELKDHDDVDEMRESANAKIKEILLRNSNSDSSTEIYFTEKIQQIENKMKEFELKAHLEEQLIESTKYLLAIESTLSDTNKATDLILMQNTDLKNLDESLMQVNEELELLQKEPTTKEIELRNHELEELIHQRETFDQENIEILRELDEYSKYEEEEKLIRDLKLDLAQKTTLHNERLERYKKIKELNNENLENHPKLLDTKCFKEFEEMKKKSEAILNSTEKKEKSEEKRNELKLKELEHKAKKYRVFIKEMDEEYNSEKKKFVNLEKQIKDAEENLEKKKTALQKKALPVIIKNEPVQVDIKNLSVIKSLSTQKPSEEPISMFSSDDETTEKEFPLSQAIALKSFSPNQNSTEDVFSFPLIQSNKEKTQSEKAFDDLLSQIRSQEKGKKGEKNISSSFQAKMKKSNSQTSIDELKSEDKERQKPTEKKFFKMSSQPLSKNSKINKRSKF